MRVIELLVIIEKGNDILVGCEIRYIDEAVYRYNTRKLSGSDCFKDMFKASIGVADYEMVKQIA